MLKIIVLYVLSFSATCASAATYYVPSAFPTKKQESTRSAGLPANLKQCAAMFNARTAQKAAAGVPEKHLPRLYLPASTPKKTVVVFTHGLFESPYFFKDMNQVLASQGFISLSILLPGHWQGDWSSMKTVTYLDWMNEVRENARIANCFGDKIIFAGHSLGGLLSLNASMQYANYTAGVMMWSPALDLKALPAIGGFIGGLLHISGNIVMGAPDLDETPLYAPNSAKQVSAMIKHIAKSYGGGKIANVYPKVTAPTFLAFAENDPAVDVTEINRAAHSIRGLDIKYVMYFPESTGVWHGNITKGSSDTYSKSRWDYNPKWEAMAAKVQDFLRLNF